MPVFIWCDGWDDGEEEMSDEGILIICSTIGALAFMYMIYKLATEKEE